MRKLYLFSFGKEGATRRLLSDALSLLEKGENRDYSEILYLAPTPRKAREAIKIFISLLPDTSFAFIPPRFLTIKTLAQEIYSSFAEKVFLPDSLKPVFLKSLIKGNFSLSYYYHIGELIKDLKSANLMGEWEKTKGLIQNNLAPFSPKRLRMEEVFAIIERYEKGLKEKSFADSEDILKELTIYLKERKRRKGVLVLDGFMDLTKLEEEFLSALINNFEHIFALAYFDTRFPESYSLPKEFVDFISSLGGFEAIEETEDDSFLEREKMDFFEFPSREEEVEGIAQKIKKLFSEGKLSLSQTIVTFPDLSSYAPIVQRVFKKYKIPFTLYPQRSLLASPVVLPVINLLRAVVDDYPFLPTITCLTSPFFSRLNARTRDFVSYYARQAKIIKGEFSWRNLVRDLIKEYKEKKGKKSSFPGIFQVERDINLFLSVSATLKRGKGKITDFLFLLSSVLKELGWPGELSASLRRDFAKGEKEELELWEDKKELVSIFQRLNFLWETECDLPEFLEILETILKYHPIIPEPEEKGVRVLGLLETKGLTAKHIFFGGLCEGSLPSPLRRDPFLPDWLREKLNLLHLERHQKWQRLHFFRVLRSAQEIYLSYPRQEGDRLFLPSPFLEGEPVWAKKEKIIFTEEERQRLLGEERDFSSEGVDFSTDREAKRVLKRRFYPYVHVTEIERMRRCPYNFYLENILGLVIEEETKFEIEPQEWGELAHQVLEKLYSGKEFIPLEEIPKRVEKILSSLLAQSAIPLFWQDVAKKIFEKILPNFLEMEKELREKGYYPERIEERVKGDFLFGINLYGKIDRIDKNQDNRYLILDYKTGGTDIYPGDIEKGKHLQLPLYSLLLRRKGLAVSGFALYSFKEKKVKWLAKDEADCQEKEKLAKKFAQEVLQEALQGIFPAAPADEGVCRFCPYSFLCAQE
ncbi:MAG: PD-(D/E)XK nuclease family protein [candidate division WOR-3 bacterium]